MNSVHQRAGRAWLARLLARRRFAALEFLNARLSTVGRGPVWDQEAFPWLDQLNAATPAINAEFAAYAASGAYLPDVQDMEAGSAQLYGPQRWEMLHLHLVGRRIAPVCARFPETERLLSQVPGLCHAKFSVLGAERHHVPRHRDGYNGVLRLHLPLQVPPGDCYIEVAGRRVDWRVGHGFVFDPGCQHEVYKAAKQERVVLIADFFRPGPAWLGARSRRFYQGLSQRPEVQAAYECYLALYGSLGEPVSDPISKDGLNKSPVIVDNGAS